MPETPRQYSGKEELAEKLSQKACRFAETLVRKDVERDTLAEVIEHHWLWTELRLVLKQSMNVWQELTVATLAVDSSSRPVGWYVEKRKEKSGPQVLADADIEKIARRLHQIRPDMRLVGVDRQAIEGGGSFAVARFAGTTPAESFDVTIDHTTGDLIGVLPGHMDNTRPIPTDDPQARSAGQIAWKQIEEDLRERVGPDVAEQARGLVTITPLTAMRDELGRRLYRYRIWTFFSTCDVSMEEESGEVVAWHVEAFQADAEECRLTEATARELAQPELQGTSGTQGPSVTFGRTADRAKATVHWWHVEDGVNIEGDQTTVLLNAYNGKIFSVARKWRTIRPELLAAPGISEAEAVRAADQAVGRDPQAPAGHVIGKSVIQVAEDADRPSAVRDVLVWRIGYRDPGGAGFTEVGIDYRTGTTVRMTGW